MAVLHAGGCGSLPRLERRKDGRRKRHRAGHSLQHLLCNRARTQDGRLSHKRKHRGFHAEAARPAVDDEVDLSLHVMPHMLRRRRAWFAGGVGARRGHRHACLADERKRRFIVRHTDGNGLKPGGNLVRHSGGAVENERKRPGPKCIHQCARSIRDARPKLLHIVLFRHMQDERVVARPALGFKNAADGVAVQPVRTEAVNGLRRERNKAARAQNAPAKARAVFLLRYRVCKLRLHAYTA